jgi:hypothetical protein
MVGEVVRPLFFLTVQPIKIAIDRVIGHSLLLTKNSFIFFLIGGVSISLLFFYELCNHYFLLTVCKLCQLLCL